MGRPLDTVLVTDLHLVLSNEYNFYTRYIVPLIGSAKKHTLVGTYNRERLDKAICERIRMYLKEDRGCSYYNIPISKPERLEVAKLFTDYIKECIDYDLGGTNEG
jgi:hypothetical protein